MTSIMCDSCKKPVPDALRGETYYTLLNRDLCAACFKDLHLAVQEVMEPRRPQYSFTDYRKEFVATLNKFCK